MSKRNLFNELKTGLEDYQQFLYGKITLHTEIVVKPEPISLSPEEIKSIRQQLNLSQAVFAQRLRT